ncbi:MAG: proline--tRNA ligase, partial [Micavibrio aeruginosavorus]
MNKPQQQKSNKPQTAITPTREDDFPGWYQAVIKAADMAENSVTRGCMVIKPYGYALWENIQKNFDAIIKDLDVENAYFPLLIPLSFIAKEADHVEGFAKECAVVTHHRLEKGPNGGLIPAPSAELEEPYVVRPTSETIIGDSMAKWIQSYRDLPLKLNQWCNVMRWEKRTRVFLRTSEFLWQEGHNAFEDYDGAEADARKMLDAYADFAEEYLAMPVFRGEKTADERFPGAIATYAMEAMMQDGKALQAATSHNLGQNFAKSSEIKFQGRDGAEHHAWTTSWGMSTRLIGGMIMIHGDDDGMIMPPKIAPVQIQIIPVMKDERDQALLDYCEDLKKKLRAVGIRAKVDASEARTPDKMWGCVKKGVPLRVEIGGREMAEGKLTHVRRDIGKDSKLTVTIDEFLSSAQGVLDDIQKALFDRAKKFRDDHISEVSDIAGVRDFFASGKIGFVKVDSSLLENAELEKMMDELALTPRCMPFEDGGKKVLIGKS